MTIFTVSILKSSVVQSVISFTNYQDLSHYLIEEFKTYLNEYNYPEDWDSDDMMSYEDSGSRAIKPTIEMAINLFSIESLQKKMARKNTLYGPWSNSELGVPFQICLEIK